MTTELNAWETGSLAPRPGLAPRWSMLRAQTRTELLLILRNGEQVLLSLILPTGLLVVLSVLDVVTLDDPSVARVDFFTPGVLALAVMSAAFTGQAIATGFERQYGVLKRLGATPLPRSTLLLAKTLSVLGVELLQLLLIGAVAYALGWEPQGSIPAVLLVLVVGTAAFSGMGLLLGGTLRGLTCLAVANVVWLLLFVLGGVMFGLEKFGAAQTVLQWLPTAALSHGLRQTLLHGHLDATDLLTLLAWAIVSLGAASRLFRWE
ncbi:MAG: type transporter [Frankiales bacterium]|nr:type transporter [Frankiales bacterium]